MTLRTSMLQNTDFICFGIYLYRFFLLVYKKRNVKKWFLFFLLLMSRHTVISVWKSLQNSANHNDRKFRGLSLIVYCPQYNHIQCMQASFLLHTVENILSPLTSNVYDDLICFNILFVSNHSC